MAFEPAAPTGPMTLNISSTPDVLGWLPEGAADRLRALRQRFSDSHRLIPASDERLAASNAKIEAARRLTRLRAHQHNGGFNLKADDARVVAAQQQLDQLTADLARMNAIYETRSAAWAMSSNVLSAVQMWLRDGLGGAALEDFDGPPPKLAKGETVLDALERLRRRGRELKADLHRIRSAPYPSAHAKKRMRAQIEELAQRGPSVARLVEHDGPVEFPTLSLMVLVRGGQGAVGHVEVIDTAALFAWLHRDTLTGRAGP